MRKVMWKQATHPSANVPCNVVAVSTYCVMLVAGVVSLSTWCVVLVAGNTSLLFSDCVVWVSGNSVNVVTMSTFRVVLVAGVSVNVVWCWLMEWCQCQRSV